MLQIFVLGALILGVLQFCKYNAKYGHKNLNISREVNDKLIPIGEKFKLTLKIENRKRMPIMFMIIEQSFPEGFSFCNDVNVSAVKNMSWHISRYTIGKYQRKNRSYTMVGKKRGAYILRETKVRIGDPLGLCIETKELEEWLEILICPKVKSIDALSFENTSFIGDNTVRRWIHKDPLYIRGIREYNVEDRMKDINWKASLKADKLMVKEYDYTSDDQLVIIINVQCGDPYWRNLKSEISDKAVDIALALSCKALNESIPTGIWSNANVIYSKEGGPLDLMPRRGALEDVIEYCTRIYRVPRQEFSIYLQQKLPQLNADTTYVIISYYMNEKDINIVKEMVRRGYKVKIIDISDNGIEDEIKGVQKIRYKGEVK